MNIRLEHIFSFTNSKTIEKHLAFYRKAEFVVGKKTVRHPPGLRNGFVYIGSEYIEFCWVEDEKAFRKGKATYPEILRKHPAPYGYGFDSLSVRALHRSLVKRGFKIPETFLRMSPEDSSVPWWEFQYFPRGFLPGVFAFALTYSQRNYAKPRAIQVGKNKISRLMGITFVSAVPKHDAERWAKIFGGSAKKDAVGYSLKLDKHLLYWMTKREFKKRYSYEPYLPPSGKLSSERKTALLHLVSGDFKKTKNYFDRAGWETEIIFVAGKKCLWVEPRKSDGFSFLIE